MDRTLIQFEDEPDAEEETGLEENLISSESHHVDRPLPKNDKSCMVKTIKVLIIIFESLIFLCIVTLWDVLIAFDIVIASVYTAIVKFVLMLLVFTPGLYRF